MVHGDPGSGKSIVLRVLAERLKKLPDVTVGAINHPQSNLADFYRELGDVFGVPLRPATVGAASRLCVRVGWPTWSPLAAAQCCWSMRRRR